MKFVAMSDLREGARVIIDGVIESDEPTVLLRWKRPAVVMVSARWFRENFTDLPEKFDLDETKSA